jgi:hypothetical protein
MSITKTLVFSNIGICNATNAANVNFYPLHVTESAEVTIEPVTDSVSDNQTLVSAYDVSFSVNVFNASILSDPLIYKDTTQSPTLARMSFTAATGGQTLNIENVFINANRAFDGNRVAINLSGSKRVTNVMNAVNLP